jgi:hypothetical protein
MANSIDITPVLSTGLFNMAKCELQTPMTLRGAVMSNVTISAHGAIFLNSTKYDDPVENFCALDFSYPVDYGSIVIAPLSDPGLFLRTNAPPYSSVLVGTAYFAGGSSLCVQYLNIGRESTGSETNLVSFEIVVRYAEPEYAYVVYRDVIGEEVDGRNAGIGIQTLEGRTLRSISYCQPGFVVNYRTLSLCLGVGTDPTNPDTDRDGLLDGEEISLGTSPHYVDTDRDGLPDDWEILHGLNPLVASGIDGASGDPDGDGLSNIDEYRNNTNPSTGGWDTDGDGVSDAAEVLQGSDPSNGSDEGTAIDAGQFRELDFNIGGDYAAWEMTITGLGPHDTRLRRISMGAPNAQASNVLKVCKGNAYRLSMRWLNSDGHYDRCAPWYCWKAQIDGLPTAKCYNNYSDVRLAGNEIVVGEGWIADNADGLLTTHVDECTRDIYGNPLPGNVADGLSATLYVLGDPVLAFDYNRDGSISDAEATVARGGNTTFRFWINDDDDAGDINGADDDIPGAGPDYADGHVNGRGDFLDFSPVWIDTSYVFPPGTPLSIRSVLRWNIRSDCVNIVWTKMQRSQAGLFQRASAGYYFGHLVAQDLQTAEVTNTVTRAETPPELHDAMQESSEFGVFLVEGNSAGTNLIVEGWTSGDASRMVVSNTANIRVSNVEDMYRHLNTRGLSGEVVTWVSMTDEPTNRPDSETSSRHLVFLHGANVTQQRARGWSSEVFKRMWQSGMTAKFTSVTWRSDIGADWNYHENVSNAFVTASELAPQIAALSGTKVLMAHSLGNLVVSSMIQDYGLTNNIQYIACNSAVPSEAYVEDGDLSMRTTSLVNSDWEEYPTNSWAASWYALFKDDPADDRGRLGWPARFISVTNHVLAVFYSTGDEVLQINNDNNVHLWTGISGSLGHYSWHKQELFKGLGGIGGTDWSGWGFSSGHATPEETNRLTDAAIKLSPVFNPRPESITNNVIPLLTRDAHRAQGIPALAPSVGWTGLVGVLAEGRRFDENLSDSRFGILRTNGWPTHVDYPQRWLHSDMKDVSYFFNFMMYYKIKEKGGL